MFEILYLDDNIVAIDKPSGIAVHRSQFSAVNETVCLQALRDQLGKRVFPVHRLDRATSGVLLFALNQESQTALSNQFMHRQVEKKYNAIVRGWILDGLECSNELVDENTSREAHTTFYVKGRCEFNWQNERYATSRYSLVEVVPRTGRYHQIRRHANHLGYPIVGDTTHGDGTHNKLWREMRHCYRLMLHAREIKITHPISHLVVRVQAKLPSEFTADFMEPY